jgi:hypothetical protein
MMSKPAPRSDLPIHTGALYFAARAALRALR